MPRAKSTAKKARSKGRRATAEQMAATQREISVAEFFAKNRHLLGYDNPSKALLTAVREAVDNALDACEEAGILPEHGPSSWTLVRQGTAVQDQNGADDGKKAAKRRGPAGTVDRYPPRRDRQRPGYRPRADQPDLRQAALRLQVPPTPHEPRAAGHRHLGGGALRPADDRQVGPDRQQASSPRKPAHFGSSCRSTPRRTSPTSSAKEERRRRVPARPRDADRARDGGALPDRGQPQHLRVPAPDGPRQPARADHGSPPPATSFPTSSSVSSTRFPEPPREIQPHPYGVELGTLMKMLGDHEGPPGLDVPQGGVLPRQRSRGESRSSRKRDCPRTGLAQEGGARRGGEAARFDEQREG